MTFSHQNSTSPPPAQADLQLAAPLWRLLLDGLRRRGEGRRESGAFILGSREPARVGTEVVFYDEVDPHAFDTGIIVMDGGLLGTLWRICRERALTVVADIHTHPAGAWQSESDRRNPMIAEPGHVALIIPNFAEREVRADEVGIYRYLGDYRWDRLDVAGLLIEGDVK